MTPLTARLTAALAAVMVAQSAAGLLLPAGYRDVEWIRATWFGNDCVTLFAAVPLLWIGRQRAAAASLRGLLLWFGVLGYAVYNYAFYMFGAALNVFLPLYVLAFVLAVATLACALVQTDATAVAEGFRPATPVNLIGGYLVFVSAGLAGVWLVMWGAYVFAGRPTPIEPQAFRIVAALDLSLIVPAMSIAGVLLWQRKAWGFLLSAIASIQAALYLWVLAVNSLVAIERGLAAAPGELPIWGLLAVFTSAAAIVLSRNAKGRRAHWAVMASAPGR